MKTTFSLRLPPHIAEKTSHMNRSEFFDDAVVAAVADVTYLAQGLRARINDPKPSTPARDRSFTKLYVQQTTLDTLSDLSRRSQLSVNEVSLLVLEAHLAKKINL